MTPAEYDAWYDTPRGRWIGETEFRLLQRRLALQPGETLLDVGCGTGWFTRKFAAGNGWNVTGLDNDPARLAYARALRFADAGIDRVVSVAALCFIDDWRQALSEMARVARRRMVVGLLNRHSLLWREKGRGGGTGAYQGAHWHGAGEIHAAMAALPLANIQISTALFLPGASPLARAVERALPNSLPWGGFLVAAADKRQ
ncbi:MAG: class I SAM-dependent methyltransferase [Pseudomonadota bacterium]|nr:class I SAM-dependent methyltransferase [Pseudomonadota bacterium]